MQSPSWLAACLVNALFGPSSSNCKSSGGVHVSPV